MSIRKDSASYINRLDRRSATDLADNLAKKKNSSETVLLLDWHDPDWLVSGTVQRLSWHVERFRLRNEALGHALGCQQIAKIHSWQLVLSIVTIERRLQKLSSNFEIFSCEV